MLPVIQNRVILFMRLYRKCSATISICCWSALKKMQLPLSFRLNRRTGPVVIFVVLTGWMVWSNLIIDWNIRRVSVIRDNAFPIDDKSAGIYELWSSTADFSTSPDYVDFIRAANNDTTGHISDGLPIERDIPDTRHILCMLRQYPRRVPPEQFSIIITFRNEIASVLIRTIVSVLRRTPAEHLGEIILIDDNADHQTPTARHRRQFNATFLQRLHHKIRWHRNVERLGATRSRHWAATMLAQYKYLLFLDSHVEVGVGWLPPLLYRLQASPNGGALISPALDIIDRQTMRYRRGAHWMRAGFDWQLRPRWFQRTTGEVWEGRWRGWNETLPFLSPIVAGGTIAVSREWFGRIGGFDGGLRRDGGGGMLELSLRAWMCGGHVEIMPCSRVGHMFAETLGDDDVFVDERQPFDRLRNAKRIAEAWLDNYRPLFYDRLPEAAAAVIEEPTGAWNRQKDWHCYSFRWYLETVFPELGLQSTKFAALGEVTQAGRCARPAPDGSVVLIECSPTTRTKTTWALRRSGKLSLYNNQTDRCLVAAGSIVRLDGSCNASTVRSRWQYHKNNHTITERVTQLCLDVQEPLESNLRPVLVLNECLLRTRRTQIWQWTVTLS